MVTHVYVLKWNVLIITESTIPLQPVNFFEKLFCLSFCVRSVAWGINQKSSLSWLTHWTVYALIPLVFPICQLVSVTQQENPLFSLLLPQLKSGVSVRPQVVLLIWTAFPEALRTSPQPISATLLPFLPSFVVAKSFLFWIKRMLLLPSVCKLLHAGIL